MLERKHGSNSALNVFCFSLKREIININKVNTKLFFDFFTKTGNSRIIEELSALKFCCSEFCKRKQKQIQKHISLYSICFSKNICVTN